MSLQRHQFSTEINRPASQVFGWHERPGALERLTPPWETIEVVSPAAGITDGQRLKLRQKIGPIWADWEVEHRGYVEGKEFSDVALHGPFASWEHRHRVVSTVPGRSTLIDEVAFELPAGRLGKAVAGKFTEEEMKRLFAFRHARFVDDVSLSLRYGAVRPMRFLIAGASGMIGSALIPFLRSQGHEVVRLVRGKPRHAGEVFWNPAKGELDEHLLKAIDAVINLTGANVAQRWSKSARDEIWNSRMAATRTLVDAIGRLKHRPFVLVSASGVGYYGPRGDEPLPESAEKGTGFLADVCDAWERETGAVAEWGVRPVSLRTGVVLSPAGGALARLLPFCRKGLGGRIGSGRQWMSWISIDDVIGAYYHAVLDQRCGPVVNAVAPGAVTNLEFSRVLAEVLERPALLPVPAPALRLAYGQMADETLLASARAVPEKLEQSDYRFRQPELEQALRFVLGRSRLAPSGGRAEPTAPESAAV